VWWIHTDLSPPHKKTGHTTLHARSWTRYEQACAQTVRRSSTMRLWVRCGPSFCKRRRIFEFWQPYFYRLDGKIRHGAKLALPVQKWPQKVHFYLKASHFHSPVCSSHVLTPSNASLNDPEAGLGLHQLGGRAQQWLAWKLKVGRSTLFLDNN